MHFVIVSYTFPPSNEIGGRRWAKFSKQLSQKGHQVSVITCSPNEDPNYYSQELPGVSVRFIPSNYPNWLTGVATNFREKLYYHAYTKIFSHFSKSNLFDKGLWLKGRFLEALESLQRDRAIDVLVVTGGPFSLLHYGAMFKQRHCSVFFVADIRDPWTWGRLYGIGDLNKRKKAFQEKCERSAISAADLFCFPTEHMGDFLKNKYPEFANKFYLLPHAFEPEKFPKNFEGEKNGRFIYGGTIYDGVEEYLHALARTLKSQISSSFRWDIYTGAKNQLISALFSNEEVRQHAYIPEAELFSKIASAKAYLAFFPVSDKDLISTKFFEIIYIGTPIIFIGDEGEVGKFIREKKLGVHILPKDIERELPKYITGPIPFAKGQFDITEFTFSAVTDRFVEMIVTNCRQLQN